MGAVVAMLGLGQGIGIREWGADGIICSHALLLQKVGINKVWVGWGFCSVGTLIASL